jgi:bifunctional DNA-binding transcriptional regulator/antitoxin component of YhaV-PrlF toxin-antitoxin module
LDRKARLVLPITLRENLGFSEFVLFKFEGGKLVVRRVERNSGRPISKNCRELIP